MKRNKKVNPELLNEELKKFRLLSEYSFYMGEDTHGYGDKKCQHKKYILVHLQCYFQLIQQLNFVILKHLR